MPVSALLPAHVAATLSIRLHAGDEEHFSSWQARFTNVISGFTGFLSVDILPRYAGAAEWSVVQQFRSAEQMDRWCRSSERQQLMEESAAFRENSVGEDFGSDFTPVSSSVTEVITTTVKPGHEARYRDWCLAIQEAQARFPGYMGTYVQSPASIAQSFWTTLVRFASTEHLDAWLRSDIRRDLVRRSELFVESWASHRLPSSFAAWFPQNATTAKPPPAWKQTAIVLLVLFPIVMLELRYLTPLLGSTNEAVATFVGNAISVSLVSWPLAPLAIRGLGWWLQPAPANRRRAEIVGAGTMLSLYGAEIVLFRQLL